MGANDEITGLALAKAFFHEAVAPVVARAAPSLRYTAGRIGPRSDALGFDDAISRDHYWGPECMLLLDPVAFDGIAQRLDSALRDELPVRFRGYSTSYRDGGRVPIDNPPVAHAVELTTVPVFLQASLGISPGSDPTEGAGPTPLDRLTPVDWLMMDEQKLLEVTGGELFRDDLQLARTRARLAFYPDDLRLHLMGVEWTKIADEQAFPARAGARGDEAGSALVQARLAESAIRLCFLLERKYPPYSKWLGTAFQRLPASATVQPSLTGLLAARDWQERDKLWSDLLAALIALHERAGLLTPGKYEPAPVYEGRPGTGLPQFDRGGPPPIPQLISDLRAPITDPRIRALSPRLGNINQLAASRDLEATLPGWRAALAQLYRDHPPPG
jgi:hypothetical protein